MPDIGWIKLHRKIRDHWIFKDPEKFMAWIDILMTMNTIEEKVNIGNQIIICGPGESLQSVKNWAMRWKWSESKVIRFFELLERDSMIKRTGIAGKTTKISICNWHTYQTIPENTRRTRGEHAENTRRTRGEHAETILELREEEEVKENREVVVRGTHSDNGNVTPHEKQRTWLAFANRLWENVWLPLCSEQNRSQSMTMGPAEQDAGVKIAQMSNCDFEEAAKRLLTYGTWKTGAGYPRAFKHFPAYYNDIPNVEATINQIKQRPSFVRRGM